MATVRRNLDSYVAHLPGVKDEVRDELDTRAERVRAAVNSHIDTGSLSRSLQVRTNVVDSTVSISDPAILSINYGHRSPSGNWVPGLHLIEAGL